jgi:hypothetical protein
MTNDNMYYYSHEADMFTFFRIPKELFSNPYYKPLSTEAKLLYGLLLDRNGLSIKNNWIDSDKRVYIIFTRKECERELDIKDKTTTKIFKELLSCNLIEERIQGLNKPNIIYVKKINYRNYESSVVKSTIQEPSKNTNQDTDNITSLDKLENTIQEGQNLRQNNNNPSDIDFKEFELNNTDSSNNKPINQSIKKTKETDMMDRLNFIYDKCNIDLYSTKIQTFIKNALTDMYLTDSFNKYLNIPIDLVREKLSQAEIYHFDTAIENYKNAKIRSQHEGTKITASMKYFEKCLWNAIKDAELNDSGIFDDIDEDE